MRTSHDGMVLTWCGERSRRKGVSISLEPRTTGRNALSVEYLDGLCLIVVVGIGDWTKLRTRGKLLPRHPIVAIDQAGEIADGLPFGQRRIDVGVAGGSQRREDQEPCS